MVSIHSGELAPNTEARQWGPSPTCIMADATSAASWPASCPNTERREGTGHECFASKRPPNLSCGPALSSGGAFCRSGI